MRNKTDLAAIGAELANTLDGERAPRYGGDDWIGPIVGSDLGFCDMTHPGLVEALRVFWTREDVLSEYIDEDGVLRVRNPHRCPTCGGARTKVIDDSRLPLEF